MGKEELEELIEAFTNKMYPPPFGGYGIEGMEDDVGCDLDIDKFNSFGIEIKE